MPIYKGVWDNNRLKRTAFSLKWLLLPLCLCVLCLALAQCTLMRARREQDVLPLVRKAAAEFDVPVAMILAVIRTESDFRADAVSDAGAMGLMQLLPSTFSFLCEEKTGEMLPPAKITDPAVNIRYGTYYLAYLFKEFGDWPTTLAAYNAGEGRVREWLRDPELSQNGVLLTIPFPETRAYVRQAMEAYAYYLKKYPQKGDFSRWTANNGAKLFVIRKKAFTSTVTMP